MLHAVAFGLSLSLLAPSAFRMEWHMTWHDNLVASHSAFPLYFCGNFLA